MAGVWLGGGSEALSLTTGGLQTRNPWEFFYRVFCIDEEKLFIVEARKARPKPASGCPRGMVASMKSCTLPTRGTLTVMEGGSAVRDELSLAAELVERELEALRAVDGVTSATAKDRTS